MKSKQLIISFISIVMISGLILGCNSKLKEHKEVIHIGYQSVTAQTWGALIIKNQKLLEQQLQIIMPNTHIKIEWHDELSGAIINNNMLSGKYQIGFMGDMPLLINGYIGQTHHNYKSELIAFDGRGKNGKNQAILVKNDSSIKSIEDLKGKTISVPIGSSSHRMLLKILNKYGILQNVTIVHQDINIGVSNLESGKVDALAAWDPYPKLLVEMNVARVLVDGSESESDYLAGVVINKTWAKQNEKVVLAFIRSLIKAHQFIHASPDKAATIFAQESKFPVTITKQEVTNITWDAFIYDKDKETLKNGLEFLVQIKKMELYDLNQFVETKYYYNALDQFEMEEF